jgi:hypothetical protein
MNLDMIRGDSKTFYFALNTDLTDAVGVWMTAKASYADGDPGVFQKTLADGISVIDETSGTISVELDPGDTSDLDGRTMRLVYDVQVEDVDNKVSTVRRGRLIVRPDVTETVTGS